MTTQPDLSRFLIAQQPVMANVMAELRLGCKLSHWMWFVFPQLGALGRCAKARFFGLDGLEQARDYLAHPELGPRLLESNGVRTAYTKRLSVSRVSIAPSVMCLKSGCRGLIK